MNLRQVNEALEELTIAKDLYDGLINPNFLPQHKKLIDFFIDNYEAVEMLAIPDEHPLAVPEPTEQNSEDGYQIKYPMISALRQENRDFVIQKLFKKIDKLKARIEESENTQNEMNVEQRQERNHNIDKIAQLESKIEKLENQTIANILNKLSEIQDELFLPLKEIIENSDNSEVHEHYIAFYGTLFSNYMISNQEAHGFFRIEEQASCWQRLFCCSCKIVASLKNQWRSVTPNVL